MSMPQAEWDRFVAYVENVATYAEQHVARHQERIEMVTNAIKECAKKYGVTARELLGRMQDGYVTARTNPSFTLSMQRIRRIYSIVRPEEIARQLRNPGVAPFLLTAAGTMGTLAFKVVLGGVILAGIGVGVYIGARSAGRIYSRLTTERVQLGQKVRERSTTLQSNQSRVRAEHEGRWMQTGYVPIRVLGSGTGGNGILSVRTKDAIERGLANSQFRHGGVGSAKAQIEKLGRPTSVEKATAVVAGMIAPGTLRSPPLAAGFVARVDGATVTIDDRGHIDFALLRELTEK